MSGSLLAGFPDKPVSVAKERTATATATSGEAAARYADAKEQADAAKRKADAIIAGATSADQIRQARAVADKAVDDARKAKIDADEAARKAEGKRQDLAAVQEETLRVIRAAQQAKRMSKNDFFATGFGAETAGKYSGTSARGVQGLVRTIGSNVAFNKLQKIRQESPTGAAVGNVSDTDMKLMLDSIATLDPTVSDEQFQQSMDIILEAYANIYNKLGGQRLSDTLEGTEKATGYRLPPETAAAVSDLYNSGKFDPDKYADIVAQGAASAGVPVDDAYRAAALKEGQRLMEGYKEGRVLAPGFSYEESDKAAAEGLGWPEAIGTGMLNLPESGLKAYAETGKALTLDLPDTVKTVGSLVGDVLGITDGETMDALGQYYVDKYGSDTAVKNALAQDPASVLLDASTVVGTLGAAGSVAKATALSKALAPANVLAAAARVPIGLTKLGGKAAGEIPAAVLGVTTGAGPQAIKEAFAAGRAGGERGAAFLENMRGGGNMEDVLQQAREAVSNIRAQASEAYQKGMVDVAKDKTHVDFQPIYDRLSKLRERAYLGDKIKNPSAAAVYEKAKTIVDDWNGSDPDVFHTPAGMDGLKQRLGDLSNDFATENNRRASSIASGVYDEVRKSINKQVPSYAKVMEGYETAAKQLKDIETTLSVKPGASVDTSLRKLQSIMRNNANTNYGRRVELGRTLEEAGAETLFPSLAGQQLSSSMPRGLGQITAGGSAMSAIPTGGASLVALPLTSPRVVGEAAYALGEGAGAMGRGLAPAMDRLSAVANPITDRLPALVEKYLEYQTPITAATAAAQGLEGARKAPEAVELPPVGASFSSDQGVATSAPSPAKINLGTKGRYDPVTDTFILEDGTRVRPDGTVVEPAAMYRGGLMDLARKYR